MIDPRAEVIENRSPYKPIDLQLRRKVITRQEVIENGGRDPDLTAYYYDVTCDVWRLRL